MEQSAIGSASGARADRSPSILPVVQGQFTEPKDKDLPGLWECIDCFADAHSRTLF